MKYAAVAAALALACFAGQARAAMYSFRWMGALSCETWPATASANDTEKAAALNWVLGYLSRAQLARQVNWFQDLGPDLVSAWLDRYCADHPRDQLAEAIGGLETELTSAFGPPHKETPVKCAAIAC
jgi:hypothetical protein